MTPRKERTRTFDGIVIGRRQRLSEAADAHFKEERRKILPGFPINEPFKSTSSALLYLSDDKITCLRCGKRYLSLYNHIVKIHGWSVEKYKDFYCLPYTHGLVSVSTSRMLSEHGKDLYANAIGLRSMSRKDRKKSRIRAQEIRNNKPPGRFYLMAVSDTAKKNQEKFISSRNDFFTTFVNVNCTSCGTPLHKLKLMSKRKVFCKKCKSQRHRIFKNRWVENNSERDKEYRFAWNQLRRGNLEPMKMYREKYPSDRFKKDRTCQTGT